METTFSDLKDLNFSAEEIGKECIERVNASEDSMKDL
jgi:hypothetical protein